MWEGRCQSDGSLLSRPRVVGARFGHWRRVDLSEEEGFLGELGLLGEWTVYSAQVIRQVRILPDRLRARA
jgi:hypothetical protein